VASAKANAGLRASISLTLPILDWGRGRGQVKMARSSRELSNINIAQSERNFEEDIRQLVRQFNQQAANMNIMAKRDITAKRRFEVARRLFLMGKSTTLDLNDATSEKDSARRSHISALSNYWRLYYNLRSLTGYDFEKGEEIEWEYKK